MLFPNFNPITITAVSDFAENVSDFSICPSETQALTKTNPKAKQINMPVRQNFFVVKDFSLFDLTSIAKT